MYTTLSKHSNIIEIVVYTTISMKNILLDLSHIDGKVFGRPKMNKL